MPFLETNEKFSKAYYSNGHSKAEKKKKTYTFVEIKNKFCAFQMVECILENGLKKQNCSTFTVGQYWSKEDCNEVSSKCRRSNLHH